MRGELNRRCFARFLSLHFTPCLLRYVSKQPTTLSGQQAAGLPLCSLTSYHALKSYASMQPGQTVVVIGASSGTGLMGVQLAKALGAARVIGVCSGKNANLVKQMGADNVIDYSEECWWQNASLLSNKADIVCVFCSALVLRVFASQQSSVQVRLRGRC
jgi:NADPH:quinone reductase-like Zn-dependent oxidoreductase